MDIRLDDGTIIRNVPNGVTKEQVQAKLDAKRARDSGTTVGDYIKALASGVNRIGASIAGTIDNSIVGDVARIASGMPTKADALLENPSGGPWSKGLRDAMLARMTPERRAKAEAAAAEYLKASPITSDIQQFFSDNAEYWNSDQSKGAQAKRAYVGGATGLVDAVRRYKNEPQAALMAATENLPQIGMMALTKNAPASAQMTLGAIGEAQMNAEEARQSVLADAKKKGASPDQAVAASEQAAELAFAASIPTAIVGGVGEVAALRRLTGASGAGPVVGGGLIQIPKQAGNETAEEFIQEASSQVAQNKAIADNYDPARALLEGAGVAGVHGAVAGGVMGAGTGAMLVPGPSEAEKAAAEAAASASPQQAADRNAAMDELRTAAEQGQQPEQPVQPQDITQDITQPAPAPQEPASGLSGVVQRAQASTAPDLTTVVNEAIASGQTPDFSALAQASNRDRSEVVDLFNRRRTLVELAESGDLNGMRDMAGRMTADPQEQQSLIEQAVAVRDKRRAMAAQTQQAAQQSAAPASPIKTPRDAAYEKMLADAEGAIASGASDVDTFLAIRKKYAGNKDLTETDINGVLDDAKASLAAKQQATAKRAAAIESAIPHLKAGDEVSAVTALADAGISGDADIQAALKEARGRIKTEQKAPAAPKQPTAPTAPAKSPMEQAVTAAIDSEAAGKGVKLGTIAKKFGVGIADLAMQIAQAKRAQANTRQSEEEKPKPSQVLALPAPQDAPIPADQPLVSRRGKLMPKAQADAMAEQSAAEKRDMRRAMSEEAGNPTGVPAGMRPRVEVPARKPQKAVLPDVILRTDGKPFPNEAEATRAMNRKGAQETHEVAPAPQGSGVVVKRKKANTIDAEKDDILAAIAKAGGVDWAQARAQGGFDPAESGRRGSGILRVFKKSGGMALDRMAETLSQYGYPVTDENGDYTVNALLDAMDAALRGSQIGTAQFNERLAREMHEQEAEWRALDDAFDGKPSGSIPSWLDDGADALVESVIDGEAQPSAVMADALNEVENEREIASPTAGDGQKADTQAEAGSGQGGNAPAAGRREAGQQEGQGGAGQDSGVQAGFQLTAQTEAERLAEEQRQAAAAEAQRKQDEQARLKAQADREISSFTLTGSDRPADVAMAAGQNDLFAPKTRGQKEAEKADTEKKAGPVSDAAQREADAAEAAKYLKDIVYSLDNLVGNDTGVLALLSSPLGKSGRDSILMDAFGIDRETAHAINNKLDSVKPHKLRAVDMEDAYTKFPRLKRIIDDAIAENESFKARKAAEAESRKADDKQAKFDELSRLTGRSSASIRQAYESKAEMDSKEEANLSLDQQILQEQLKKARDNTPANKKFDSLIATAADSPAKLRDHDIERVLDNAGSRSELVRLRDYLSSLRPDKAEFIADAANDIGGDKGFDMTGSKAAKPEPEPRAIDENGRPTDGKPIIPGDTFRTLSGRTTTPYPKQKGEKYASQWLIDNATAEAEARGDDFNAPIFRRTSILKDGTLTTADSESLNMYLFGEQPAVVPSILKPLISDEDRTPAAIVSPRDSLIDEINAAIKDADGIGLTETSKRLQELNRDVYDRIETPENGRKRLAAIISDMKNPLLSGDWVSLGKGRIVFRWEGMDYGRIEDTRITEDRGDGVSNPWRTSDGALHGTLRQAKKHESDTYTKPRLERDGYIQPEGSEKQKQSADYGSNNKLVTNDRAAEIRAKLKSKLNGSQLNSGFDPEILALGAELAAFHIEAGVRKFADFAKAIAADLYSSVSELRPYLRAWFNGARDMIEDAGLPIEGMDSPEQVRDALAVIDKEIADSKNNGVITPESLQDYVIKQIQDNVSAKFPGGESPLAIREVESTDFSIGEILQAHPAVANRREDPATYKKFAEAAKLVDNGAIRKAIIGTRDIAPFGSRPSRNTQEDQVNARDTGGTSSESGGGNEAPANKGVVLNEQRRTEHSDGFAGQSAGREIEGDATGGARVSGVRPADGGERGNQPVRSGFGQFQPTDDTAGGGQRTGGAESGDTRVQVDRAGSAAVVQAVGSVDPEVTRQKKLAAQRQAESIPVAPGDKENIDATLPFLLDGQREDIYTAEKRFAAKNGHGMLFTNGTGTGKTFLALGIIKRFARQGKGNVLVVVPNDAVIKEWTTSAPALGLTINQLADTKDKVTGVSITTYANFGQNDAIAFRDYDLVVMDEAHNLMQNADAGGTAALSTLRAITRHEEGIRRLTDMQNRDLVDGMAERSKKIFENSENLRGVNKTSGTNGWKLKVETDRLDAELREMRDKWNKAYEDNKRKALSSPRPKALFLSATPFAYEKNVVWAQGYLFDWNEGKPSEENRTRAYNEPDNYERFMIQHFGYRMRYNKLTEPDAKVDRDLMQREFNATLRKSGALSARMLDVPSDYQRVFALTPSALGTKIDDGLTWLREAENGKFRLLYDVVSKRFDYLSRQRLLEAMKAEAAIPMIQKWHELGKKVVVFYDFNEGGGFAPFNRGNYKPDGEDPQAFGQLVQDFYAARPDLKDLNTAELPSPLEALLSAFPNAGVYNGRVSKKKRAADMEAFNDDNNRDANLLIVQSAANAGWSAHDKSGKFKRVLINLGMPTAPTKAIQQEGRIYRQGQHPESDSMFVYMNTGTSWERAAFAGTIARRASTAENLAMGEQARGLRDAFIMAFEDSEIIEPSLDEGKGSKEKDRALTKALSPFDRAKSYYFGQLKKTSATKAREGKDYFATPEPVGMKMVEWLNLEGGEKALEPSAGHGAISRWLPDNTENTIVEPSFELISRAALNTNAKQINGNFEDLNIVNKYHGIVMNPPFGVGGKTAIEHLDKAFRHLSDGGRIVALIPEGPAADKRFDEWMYGRDDKDKPLREDAVIRAVIRLPASTFDRAGTNVRTRIVVIDRVRDETQRKDMPSEASVDLSGAGDINSLFSRIENIDIPARIKKEAAASSEPAADAGTGSALLAPKETTHAIKKIPLFVAAMSRRVDGDTFTAINRIAKRHGGYYSAFSKNKAIPGFQFESEQARKAFMDEVGDGSQYGAAGPTGGVAEGLVSGDYSVNTGGINERNAGSLQSRKRAYGSHSAESHDDLFATAAVSPTNPEARRNRTDFSKHFTTVSENIEHGQVKVPERIAGHADAAAIFSRWKDYSQERFIVAGLDENGRVVEVAVHSVGLKDSASVDPGTVAGMVSRNPDIKSVWISHNHPSGSTEKSAADSSITAAVDNLISATGIKIDGHVILGSSAYSVIDATGEYIGGDGKTAAFAYKTVVGSQVSAPLVDRVITRRGLGTVTISGPGVAKSYVSGMNEPGIVLMDTQLNVLGFWAMTPEQMNQMRQNQESTRSLLAAIDASNASRAIISVADSIVGNGMEWKNISAMLASSGIEVVDAISYKSGESAAEKGMQIPQKGRPFYSTSPSAPSPGLTIDRAREILSADPVLSKALPFIDIRNSKEGVPEGAEPFGEEGYYHNGRITLFADNIRATGSMSAEERLRWVAFHEVTHRGVANLAESQAYLSELRQAGKNPYVKNLAKKIYEKRKKLPPKYHVTMEVAIEEALAEINAALRTGNVKQIKEQYGLHFPLSIRPRAKSAVARFFEVVKRIVNRMFGRGLTDAQVEDLLRRTNDAGMTPDGGPGRGKDYDAAVFSLADKGDGSPTELALAEARRQLDEQLAIADRMIAERGGLFAPNGQPSKLNRYQWAQVRTANFKRWFGDWEGDPAKASKVVDDNGEPLVVYHGTRAMGFNEFKLKSAEAYGLGVYFAADRTMPEEEFGVDGRVIEAFLNIRNPSDGSMPKIKKNSEALKKLRQSRPRFRGDEYDAFEEYGDFRGEAIREVGHDGIIAENDEYGIELVAFSPNQIKSAIGNAGTFSGGTDDIRYSPSPRDWITEQGRITKRVLSKEVAQRDLTLWQKTLGTQLNAALKNPAFKKVYDLTQRLIQHVNNDAYDSLNAAPDVLSRLEDWNDYKRDIANTAKEAGAALTMRQSKRRKDMTAAAEVLFEGTRFDKKVYSDKELDAFKLTADQKEIYRQARAAIDKSVGNAGKSQALNVAMNAEAINWTTVERLVNMDLEPDALFSEVRDLIDARIANAKTEISNTKDQAEIDRLDKQVDKLVAAMASIGEIQAIVEKSATEGYAPLMRWGKYTVAVIDPVDGKTLRFHMLESKREQAALELQLREKYGAANVVGGVLDEGKFEQFKGITPETVALFASVTGMDQDAAYQEYLKLAIPGRSALKRKIHRKGDMGEGIEGFSTDLPRVLSSFVLSNARKSARDLYRGPVNDAIEDINAGGVAEKARELAEFVMEPDENDWSVGIRNLLFVWNMGASVAFGVLNLSQPWMMTLPWLSQFRSPTEVAGIMGRAAKLAAAAQASGKAPKGYEAEYDRAVREGIVDPQNVFMLQGVERGKSGVGSNIWRNVAHGMGLIASATESLNRKLTLIAALDVARAKGDAWLKSKGFADAYDFAARSVAETQGIYNKGNRPAWARSPVGAVLLVFKQYAINWVEMAGRMASNHYGDDRYRKGFWMLIGALFMMAGGMGLPFAEDLIDLIETGMSWAGKPVNVERQMQMALGKDLYEPLMNGPVNSMLFNAAGADMFGRMTMGNLIPATAVANPGLTKAARADEGLGALGAGAGLATKAMDAYNQAAAGDVGHALVTASPRAVTSIAKAVEMATTGEYKDSKGRTVREVTPAEALIKGLDLQPASVARIQRERGRRFKDEAIQAQAKETIRNALIDAYESDDRAAIDEAERKLGDWNRENPLYPVRINRRGLRKTVRERGKNWSARDEAAKGMEWMDEWIPESSK